MMNKNTEPDYDEKSSVDVDNLILHPEVTTEASIEDCYVRMERGMMMSVDSCHRHGRSG